MGFKPKISVQLVTCGTCKKTYNNPFTHVCKINLSGSAKKTTNARKAANKKGKK